MTAGGSSGPVSTWCWRDMWRESKRRAPVCIRAQITGIEIGRQLSLVGIAMIYLCFHGQGKSQRNWEKGGG